MNIKTLVNLVICSSVSGTLSGQPLVGETPSKARSVDDSYISWKEHLIDDPVLSGVPFSGSDGLVMADLDLTVSKTLFRFMNQTQTMILPSQAKLLRLWVMSG